jgi:hypothetical protein
MFTVSPRIVVVWGHFETVSLEAAAVCVRSADLTGRLAWEFKS